MSRLESHIVPQDLTVSDKLLGPLDVFQSLVFMAAFGVSAIVLLSPIGVVWKAILIVMVGILTMAVMFIKIEDEYGIVWFLRWLAYRLGPHELVYARQPGRASLAPKQAPVQERVLPVAFKDGIVCTRDGTYCVVLEATSVNIDLLSEDERWEMEQAFRRFLETLSYPIAVYSLAAPPELQGYFERVRQREARESNPLIREMLRRYNDEMERLLREGKLISRRTLIVLTLRASSPGTKGELRDFHSIRDELHSRAAAVAKEVQRMGIQARMLGDEELVRLYHSLYNRPSYRSQPVQDPGRMPPVAVQRGEDR